MGYEFNILYYVEIYKKWWKAILKIVIITVFFTAIFSLRLPIRYISTVTLIPADMGQASTASSLGRFLGISNASLGASSNDVIVSIITSKRMANDINNQFIIGKNKKMWWSINIYGERVNLYVEVRGSDGSLTEKIANFAVQNLDKINAELNITPNKPMAKVLDPATYGISQSRQIIRKVFLAGILSFLAMSFYIFLLDYFEKLKSKS